MMGLRFMKEDHVYVFRKCQEINPFTKEPIGKLKRFTWTRRGGWSPYPVWEGLDQNCDSKPDYPFIIDNNDIIDLADTLTDVTELGKLRRWEDEIHVRNGGVWGRNFPAFVADMAVDVAALEARLMFDHHIIAALIKDLPLPTPKKTIVYICGKFSKREEFKRCRHSLEIQGYEVSGRWLDQIGPAAPFQRKQIAEDDVADINRADVLIVDGDMSTKAGMIWELGYATAKGKRIYMVGELPTIFAELIPPKNCFKDWFELLASALPSGRVKL